MVKRFKRMIKPAVGPRKGNAGISKRLAARGFKTKAITRKTNSRLYKAMDGNKSKSLKSIMRSKRQASSAAQVKARRMAKTESFLKKRGFMKPGTVRAARLRAVRTANAKAARSAFKKGVNQRFRQRIAKARGSATSASSSKSGSSSTVSR